MTHSLTLQESLEFYRDFVEMSQDLIWQCDTEGRYTYLNPAWEAVFGYTITEMLGKKFSDFQSPAMAERDLLEFTRLLNGGVVKGLETVHLGKSGNEIHLQFEAKTVFDQSGVAIGTRGTAHDNTDRKRVEAALRDSEHKFSRVFRDAPVWISITDMSDATYLDVNEQALRATGFVRSEVIGQTAASLGWITIGDRARLVQEINKHGHITGLEMEFHAKDGRILYGWVTGEPISFGGHACLLTVTTDITKRKKTEEALVRSEVKFRTLFDSSSDAVMLLDGQGFLDGNKAALEMFGCAGQSELQHQHPKDISAPIQPNGIESVILAKQYIETAMSSGSARFEWLSRRRDGAAFPSEVLLSRMELDGKPILQATIHNITGRKQAELALLKSKQQYDRLTSSIPVGTYVLHTTAQGEFSLAYASTKMAEIFQTSVVDMLADANIVIRAIHPEERADFEKLNREGIPLLKRFDWIGRILIRGMVKWVHIESTPEPLADGEALWNGLVTDITEQRAALNALQESERRFSDMATNSPGVIYQFYARADGSTGFYYVSPKSVELLGLSSDVTSPDWQNLGERLHPEDKEAFLAAVGLAIHDLKELNFECRMTTSMGLKWIHFLAKPILQNNEILFNGIIMDTTERKKAETAQQELRILLQACIESPKDIIIMAVDRDYRYLCFNSAHSDSMHRSDGKPIAIGMDVLECITVPEDRKNALENYDRALAGESFFKVQEYGEGEKVYYDCFFNPIRNEIEEIIGVTAYAINTTQRRRAEDKLRESEERLSTLFGSMTEMVALHEIIYNENGEAVNYRITDCNHAFTKITGISKDAAVGKLATDVYQTKSAPYLEIYAQVAMTGQSQEYTTYFAPMDKHFSISVVSPRKNSFATITTDISGIKQIQEVITTKNKELENYLYVASHDLRSPLVNVQGFSQRMQAQARELTALLTSGEMNPEARARIDKLLEEGIPKTLKFILSSVNKMDALINGLLQISRTGRLEMTVVRVNMNQLIKAVLIAHSYQITDAAAQYLVADLPDCYGDENLLNQLFSNIIANAIKYRDPSRALQIDISAITELTKIRYRIADNGIGIDERLLERIWDVFYRVNPTSKDLGDGLGLSIIKRIAEKHRGKVWACSKLGSGSEFYVELPKSPFSNN